MAPISSQNKPEEVAVREIRVFELLFACVLLHFGGKRVKACLAGSATHLERFAAFAATFTSQGVKLRVREKTASFKPMRVLKLSRCSIVSGLANFTQTLKSFAAVG